MLKHRSATIQPVDYENYSDEEILMRFKRFYETPMSEVIIAFLKDEHDVFEMLLRRVHYNPLDKKCLIDYMGKYADCIFKQCFNKLTAGEAALLGLAYEHGFGVTIHLPTAILLYTQAIAQKHYASCEHLANLHEQGLGIKKDLKAAKKYENKSKTKIKILKYAAAHGHVGSLLKLAQNNEIENPAFAHRCYEAAAAIGDEDGLEKLCNVFQGSTVIPDFAKKVRQAAEYMENNGNGWGLFYLARFYENEGKKFGKVQPDIPQAIHYFRLGSSHRFAQVNRICRANLKRLYDKYRTITAQYHMLMCPVVYKAAVLQQTRQAIFSLSHAEPDTVSRLAKRYHDTWGRVQILLDPTTRLTSALSLLSLLNEWHGLPSELLIMIACFAYDVNQINLLGAMRVQHLLVDELRDERLAIICKRWEKTGVKRDAVISGRSDGKTFIKHVPATEVEKWKLTIAIKQGTLLFSDGIKRIQVINDAQPKIQKTT